MGMNLSNFDNITAITAANFSVKICDEMHVFMIDGNKSSEYYINKFFDEIEEEKDDFTCTPVPATFYTWLTVMLICFMVFGILFNGFILLTFIQLPRIRSFTNYFVASLTVADILMVILNPILFLLLLHENIENEIGNILRFHSELFCSMASLISFACISLDRMLAIAKPLYHRTLPRSRCIKIIVLIWVFSVIAISLDYFVSEYNLVDTFVVDCCNFCIACAIPTLITIISYIIIARVVICRQTRTFQETHQTGSDRMKHTIRITWKILLVILPGVAIWCVYWIPVFIESTDKKGDKFSPSFQEIRSLLPILAATVNPLIFVLLTPEFRKHLLKLLCCRNRIDLGRISNTTVPAAQMRTFSV